MKYYLDCFGVCSVSKAGLIVILKYLLENNGSSFNVEIGGAKYLKHAKPDEYGYFIQGKKVKHISLGIINVVDDWEDSKERVERLLNEVINS